MEVIYYFLFGFVASVVGVIPPGLLNLTAAKISIVENRKNAFLFSLGVVTTVAAQVLVALLFARYLDKHPKLISMLQLVGLGIFICITCYFFFIAKDTRKTTDAYEPKSKKSHYFHGLLLATINLFPLPYWVYLGITFSAFGWFDFTKTFILNCVLGAVVGTLAMLVLYAQYFNYIKSKQKEFSMNMNYVIGAITGVISAITLFKIIKDYY
ncbi:MAG TPA: LysE family transporter [Flavobacteriaceae bacterium]|nr:LysE family transporter [Flavobacteriaceae bacterium]